jgi:hypothetical protein
MCYVIDKSFSEVGRWLKTMKQVITLREKQNGLIEENSSIEFSFMSTEVDGKISVEVFS